MARRVFFSFHYERDVWRASQVRNSWVTKPDRESAGFWDAVEWEEVKKKGDEAIKKWIDKQLEGTSVTVVLIGYETAERKYVQYEIKKSWERGNGLLGIYIHNLKDSNGKTDIKGKNPFDFFIFKRKDNIVKISTYDWIYDNGYNKLNEWIEKAAREAGR
ncbi:MAG: TIR domain-containing protein [Ignavibacterium sp.]|nr:TIR domain-containing protein [Ignavibacterium sp.]